MTGVLVLVAAFVAWRVVVSFRRNKQPAPLPKSAMQRIRAAQGRELSARAGTELQALGDKLDELEIAPVTIGSPGSPRSTTTQPRADCSTLQTRTSSTWSGHSC